MRNPHLPPNAKSNLGPAAYMALRQYRGNDLPKWDELSDQLREEWCDMTEGQVESFMQKIEAQRAQVEAHKALLDIIDTAVTQHRNIQNF